LGHSVDTLNFQVFVPHHRNALCRGLIEVNCSLSSAAAKDTPLLRSNPKEEQKYIYILGKIKVDLISYLVL